MSEPTQRMVETNRIRLNIAEQGNGPVVLLCLTSGSVDGVAQCGGEARRRASFFWGRLRTTACPPIGGRSGAN